MKKFKKVRVEIDSVFYKSGPGTTRDRLQKFEDTTKKFFETLGWKETKKISNEFFVVEGVKLKNPNYDDSCYLYCHPYQIFGVIPCEVEESFKEYVKTNWNTNLHEFGEIVAITSFNVYKDVTKEDQVDYLKSIEPELISIIKNHKESDGCLMHRLLEKRLKIDGYFNYCVYDADYIYLKSLIEKTRKNA